MMSQHNQNHKFILQSFSPSHCNASVWQKDEICVCLCFCHLEGKTAAGLVVMWQKWEGMAKMINNGKKRTEIKWKRLRPHERETGRTKTALHNSHLAAVHCLCYLRQKPESIKERLCSRACQSGRAAGWRQPGKKGLIRFADMDEIPEICTSISISWFQILKINHLLWKFPE